MKAFTKEEKRVVGLILFAILSITLVNFRSSFVRSRDAQRKSDLNSIASSLEKYNEDFGFFPPEVDGKITACKKDDQQEKILGKVDLKDYFAPCRWGEDSLRDLSDPEFPPYIVKLHADPQTDMGVSYLYKSDTKHFQLYAHLEGASDVEIRPEIVSLGLMCGKAVCNYGKTQGGTPLDMSLDEYNAQLEKEFAK